MHAKAVEILTLGRNDCLQERTTATSGFSAGLVASTLPAVAVFVSFNEVAVISDRMGCGEVGQNILDIMYFVAAEIGLPKDYKEHADEDRLVNEGVAELMEQYPE